jgi:nicotinate phosphoribosyltransferase
MEHFLDNDMYKLSMQNLAVRQFPDDYARYEFFNRGGTPIPKEIGESIHTDIQSFADFNLEALPLSWLREALPFLSPMYLDFLKGYRFDASEVKMGYPDGDDDLKIHIEGPWYRTILWEVPLMALISENYFKYTGQTPFGIRKGDWPAVWMEIKKKSVEKAKLIDGYDLTVADFGTRRRYSPRVHDAMMESLGNHLVGSSNVWQAMTYRTKPIGTHAHEWFQFHAAKYGYVSANRMALENWSRGYRGNLGIALTDTFTTDVFLRDFDAYYAKLFDGVRHDSGDPYEFANKIIGHYDNLGIDPKSKTIVFSDNLTVEKAVKISETHKDHIKCSFGIGTHLTNDVGVKPLNMVIKLTGVRAADGSWKEAIKLSDDVGKHTGSEEEIKLCKETLDVK